MPEIIDPVFAKTSQNARFLLSENERFGLVFVKTRVYKFGHRSVCSHKPLHYVSMNVYSSAQVTFYHRYEMTERI